MLVDTDGLLESVYLISRGRHQKHAAHKGKGKPGRTGFAGVTVYLLHSTDILFPSTLKAPAAGLCQIM